MADRIGERPLVAGGSLLQAVGLAWIALIAKAGLAYPQMIPPMALAGAGVSMAVPSAQSAVVRAVAAHQIGKASGAFSMMRQLGGVFGLAIVVAVFTGAGSYGSARAFSNGFVAALAVAAGLSLAHRRRGAAPATGSRPSTRRVGRRGPGNRSKELATQRVVVRSVEDDGDGNPLPGLASFQAFQERIGERCQEPPVVEEPREIGWYRMFGD